MARAPADAPAGSGRGLFESVKRKRTGDALRYAGARMSTVGRRVVPSGRRQRLGAAVRLDDSARSALVRERRQDFRGMADVRRELARLHEAGHWSEAAAW
jgi:hypothetical protein